VLSSLPFILLQQAINSAPGCIQALRANSELQKVLCESKAALDDLEAVATTWQQTSKELERAVREMGDVENLLEVLQANAECVAEAVCKMTAKK
jgi:hypothetical protein